MLLAAFLQAHYIAHYQLPPTQFWAHWSGGMSVVDAFLVFAWIGLATCYLYNNITSKFENIPGEFIQHQNAFNLLIHANERWDLFAAVRD